MTIRKMLSISMLVPMILSLVAPNSLAQSFETKKDSLNLVYKFDIQEEIGPAIWRKAKQAFDEAQSKNADYIVIHMNTYGGAVDNADSIRTLILNTTIPVYVFIDNNAASAGALISIACDSIYMRKGASIGAATVVNQEGQVMPDKYQSYMRSMMRSTAEANGRDPEIAQAMVDPNIFVEGISDTGQVLTFTTSEAIENNFCEGEAESIEQVLELAGISDYEIVEYKATTLEMIIGHLVNPVLHGILIMIIIGGIYFELQSPGIGFPIAASFIAAILYFAPLYLEGLADNWEIVIFIVGLILIALEVFVIPGFGVAGIIGAILCVTGLALSMVWNVGFDFTFTQGDVIIRAFVVVFTSIIISIIISVYFGGKLLKTSAFQKLVLETTQQASEGYTGADSTEHNLVGKTGLAATILRPSGKVEIEGNIYDAIAETGYIERGQQIKVIKFETTQLFVRITNNV